MGRQDIVTGNLNIPCRPDAPRTEACLRAAYLATVVWRMGVRSMSANGSESTSGYPAAHAVTVPLSETGRVGSALHTPAVAVWTWIGHDRRHRERMGRASGSPPCLDGP